MKKESDFQKKIIDKIKSIFPEVIIYKTNGQYLQGFPDLVIFYKDKYAVLEIKRSKNETTQPNQQYYLEKFGKYVYSSKCYPENFEEVIYGIQQAFAY